MPHFLNPIPNPGPDLGRAPAGAPLVWHVTTQNERIVLPNVADWKPGDVILVSAMEPPSVTNTWIRNFQYNFAGLSEHAANTIHVGIFDGEKIWDTASGQDVKDHDIADFFEHVRCYAIRRFEKAVVDPVLLKRFLEAQRGKSYWGNVPNLVRLLWRRQRGKQPIPDDLKKVTICTTLVARALQVAGNARPPKNHIIPADFADSPIARRIDIEWLVPEMAIPPAPS